MAILKLKPAYKDYIWGGQRLVEQYGKDFPEHDWLKVGNYPVIQMGHRWWLVALCRSDLS